MEHNESLLKHHNINLEEDTNANSKRWLTLHCEQCRTVLGDSFSVCGEVMDSVMCTGVTNDVIISDEMQLGHEGDMTDCIYSSLRCRSCCCAVGKVIHSAPSHLAVIRSLYLLHKANISCYILNSCSVVKASTLNFDVKPLKETIHEVRQQFEAQFDAQLNQMSRIKSKLAGQKVKGESNKSSV